MYSLLKAVAAELDNELSPATYSALKAVAVELLKLLLAVVCAVFNATLWVWAAPDNAVSNWFLLTSAEALNAVNSASEAKSVSNAAIEAELIANKASLWVCAAPDKALSPATYSLLSAVAIELLSVLFALLAIVLIASLCVWALEDKAVSPAVYSVLNAEAAEPE